MKKNKFMRLASVMLMLCLITTCAISGTFAKYTTSDSATDSARVAKWGVTVTMMDSEEIFATQYKDEAIVSGGTVIGGNNDTDVVAPGTKGTLSTIAIDGAPEVTVDVTTEITLDLGENWVAGGTYCPIVFTVGTETYGLTGMKIADGTAIVSNQYATVEALESAVINAILTTIYGSDNGGTVWTPTNTNTADITVRYAPNHDFDAISETFSWAWAFKNNDDAKDTILGNLTADVDAANDPTINFSMSVLVEQVD